MQGKQLEILYFRDTSEFTLHQNDLIFAFDQFKAYQLSKIIIVIPRLFKEGFVINLHV